MNYTPLIIDILFFEQATEKWNKIRYEYDQSGAPSRTIIVYLRKYWCGILEAIWFGWIRLFWREVGLSLKNVHHSKNCQICQKSKLFSNPFTMHRWIMGVKPFTIHYIFVFFLTCFILSCTWLIQPSIIHSVHTTYSIRWLTYGKTSVHYHLIVSPAVIIAWIRQHFIKRFVTLIVNV